MIFALSTGYKGEKGVDLSFSAVGPSFWSSTRVETMVRMVSTFSLVGIRVSFSALHSHDILIMIKLVLLKRYSGFSALISSRASKPGPQVCKDTGEKKQL